MKKYLPKITLIFFFFFAINSYSQLDISHEVGIMFGVTSFQTDFGERYDFPSANAASMGFGVMHYLKFYGNQYNWRSGTSFFSDHFKLKTSFDYIQKTNIKHEPWVGLGDQSEGFAKLEAMRTNIKMYNIGSQLEFYFSSLENYSTLFSDKKSFNPYLSAGVHFSFYDPKVTSELNDSGGPNDELNVVNEPFLFLYKEQWQNDAVFNEPGTAFSVSVGAGLRYSMEYFDMILDTRWQHFFSDKIDGLDAPNDPGNKYNDTMVYVNLGIVYTFNQY